MSRRCAIGLVLILVEAVALGLASGRMIHVAVPLATSTLVVVTGRRVMFTFERYLYTLAGLGALAILWWILLPPRVDHPLQMFPAAGTSLLYTGALYCLWHQTLQIAVIVDRPYDRLSGPFPSFPFIGVFALAIAGHYTFWAVRHNGCTGAAVVYAMFTVLYYCSRDREFGIRTYPVFTRIVLAALLVGALGGGVGTAIAVRQNETAINDWLNRLTVTPPPESALGFSREGRLDNVTNRRTAGDDQPVLFAFSDRAPGYLRGLVFDSYRDSRWSLPNPDRWVAAREAPPAVAALTNVGRNYFPLTRDATRGELNATEIFTVGTLLDTVFLPATATAVLVDTDAMGLDPANAVRETKPARRPGYVSVESTGTAVHVLSEADRKRYTALPELDPRVDELAKSITGRAGSNREKADAIELYFIQNYEYQIGIYVPPTYDPLTYFLLYKPKAHCEYFASGAAVMLRLSGVPARYVTGFVTVERNETGEFFVARNKDAHAWVEAWDPELGWFIVEATPPAGVPQAREVGALSALRDTLSLAWNRFRDRLGTQPLDAFVQAMGSVLDAIATSIYGKVLLGLLIALTGIRVYRRRRSRVQPASLADHLVRLRELIARADALARAEGISRADNETVRNFAERVALSASDRRVQDLAQWYREYDRVRYRDATNAAAHAFLESALPAAE